MKIITGYNKSAIDSNSNSIVYQYNMMFDDRLVSQAVSKVLGVSSRYSQDFYTRLLQYIAGYLSKVRTTKTSVAVQNTLKELSQTANNLISVISQPVDTQLDYQIMENIVRETYGEGAIEDVIATISSMGNPLGEDMSEEELEEHLDNLLKEATGDVESAADSSIADRVGYWLGTISEEIRQIAGVNEVASDVDDILDEVEEATETNDPTEPEEEEAPSCSTDYLGWWQDHVGNWDTGCRPDWYQQGCTGDLGHGCGYDIGNDCGLDLGFGCGLDLGFGCRLDQSDCEICDVDCDSCDSCYGDCDICDFVPSDFCRRDYLCDTCDQCISNGSTHCKEDFEYACNGCTDDVLICDICDFNSCQVDFYCNYCNYSGYDIDANCKADYICNICDTSGFCDGCRQNFDCYYCDWNCRADYICNQEHNASTACRRDMFHNPTECLDFVECTKDTQSCFSNTFCSTDCTLVGCNLCDATCILNCNSPCDCDCDCDCNACDCDCNACDCDCDSCADCDCFACDDA